MRVDEIRFSEVIGTLFIKHSKGTLNTKEDAVKLGFIGAGFIAKFQARAMVQMRGIEVSGILRRRGIEALTAFCRDNRLGDSKIYDSIQELAKHSDVLAIYAPNYVRISIMEEIVDALKGGAKIIGVICEKPLGRNMKEARRMLELAKEAGVLTAYFENQIHMKAIQREKIQLVPVQEKMGTLSLVRSAEEHGGPHEAWFWNPIYQSGGV